MNGGVRWCSPHVTIAQYAQKHPVEREEISVYCQTDCQISAKQGIVEAVDMTKSILGAIDVGLETTFFLNSNGLYVPFSRVMYRVLHFVSSCVVFLVACRKLWLLHSGELDKTKTTR